MTVALSSPSHLPLYQARLVTGFPHRSSFQGGSRDLGFIRGKQRKPEWSCVFLSGGCWGRRASCPRHISVLSIEVVGAKVVTNARSPGARCYGFVTMSTAEEATKCINHLHKTELHGKMISVEKVRGRSLSGL